MCAVIVVSLAAFMGACSGDSLDSSEDDSLDSSEDDSLDASEEEVGSLEQALFDSDDIRTTAGSAMINAYDLTLGDGDRFEYCGLIVRKTNGDFRAGRPTTTREEQRCNCTITIDPGELLVGYYHTHTAASAPGLSPADISVSESTALQYFVLSTATGCGQQYIPQTNQLFELGCPL